MTPRPVPAGLPSVSCQPVLASRVSAWPASNLDLIVIDPIVEGERLGPAGVSALRTKPDGGRLRTGPGWAYEYKLDGYRCCLRVAADGTTVLTSRNGIDFTAEFPTLTGVFGDALGRAAVLDGEIVACTEDGRVDFGLLQERRGRYQKRHGDGPFDDAPVRFLAFDLLFTRSVALKSMNPLSISRPLPWTRCT